MPRINWKGASWDADTICTPQGVPYAYQIYGYPVAPGHSRENHWVPLAPLVLSTLDIESSKSVLDSIGTVDILVTLTPVDNTRTVTVAYTTVDGTAIAGTDYTTTSGTLTFLPTEDQKTISVPILNRNRTSATNFTVTLSSPTNAVLGTTTCTVTIQPDSGST